MKKLSIALLCATLLAGCSAHHEPAPHDHYVTTGRYYLDSTVITADGNIWDYQADTINDRPAENAMPVYVAFDDNGTPDNIYDDAILGLVLDLETHIYDRLECALSDADTFTIERDGNNIHVTPQNN